MDPRSCSSSHKTPHQTLLHNSDGAMLSRLLRLLVLCSLCPGLMGLHSNNTQHSNKGTTEDTHIQEARMLSSSDPSTSGLPDMAICDMLLNGDVPTTVDRIPLYCFCSHCKDTVGPKGDQGDRGPAGVPGSPGRRGMTGFKGRRGFTGPQGIKGQKGDLGEEGQPGTAGFTGTKGGRGFKGDKGDIGLIGTSGAEGPQGEAGTCPASCGNVQGPPGPQGPPGLAGARGLPGVKGTMGSGGYKGDNGDLGSTGEPGMRGQKGDEGEQGVCECTDGADGNDGTPGVEGPKGVNGDTGEHGVQGVMGLKGGKGDTGLFGLPGPCSPAIQSAFSACVIDSYPVRNYPVPFPHVLTNQQGHFDPFRGIYTAPVNGTYVFSFHLAVANLVLKVGLFRNFYPIVKNTEATDRSTTSQTVILHLNMGDRLWLQVKDATNNGLYTDKESSSTFSGYLLFPDTCDLRMGRGSTGTSPIENEEEDFNWDGPEMATASP